MFSQADNLPDIPPQTVTEEKFIDEQGNMVVKKVRPLKQQHHQKHQNKNPVHVLDMLITLIHITH